MCSTTLGCARLRPAPRAGRSRACKSLHGLALPDCRASLDPLADLGRQQLEASVYPPAVALGLLLEGDNAVSFDAERSEPLGWTNGRHRSGAPVISVEADLRLD